MNDYDVAIIGAGIAGASLAATLPERFTILLLEAEDAPGYHATGRSAAFWSETYGGPGIQPLTSASFRFLDHPDPSFASGSFLKRCGSLHLGTQSDAEVAAEMLREFAHTAVHLRPVETGELDRILPGRQAGWGLGLWEADCCDIDVGRLHNAYLSAARRKGVRIATRSPVVGIKRQRDNWQIETRNDRFVAGTLVNAAGAWADEVATMAGLQRLGITPYRRTIMQLRMVDPVPECLPLVVGLDGSFYFKRESGGRLWLSPHDEIPSPPCDSAAEEIDVAAAIARFEEVMQWRIAAVERKWAGLRSFAPDRLPVIGPSSQQPRFFWLAGQGGFGIQTAPAVAAIAAALLQGQSPELPGVDYRAYLPDRLT